MQPASEKCSYLEELSCKEDSQKRIGSILTKTRTTHYLHTPSIYHHIESFTSLDRQADTSSPSPHGNNFTVKYLLVSLTRSSVLFC